MRVRTNRIWPVVVVAVGAVGCWCGSMLGAGEPLSLPSDVIRLTPDEVGGSPPVITAVRLQPGGRFLVMAGDDHVVRIWDLQQRRIVQELRVHQDWVDTAAFSPDGRWLATAGNDHRVVLSDVAAWGGGGCPCRPEWRGDECPVQSRRSVAGRGGV